MNKVFRKIVMALSLTAVCPWAAAAVGDPDEGEKLVAVCSACHGADGNIPTPNFPKLAGLGDKYMLKQLLDIKSGEREVVEMTGLLDGMSDTDLANVAAYYDAQPMQLSGSEAMEVQVNSGAMVDGLRLGERIYRGGNLETDVPACTGCHSPRGLGNDPAGFPRLSGQHAQYIEKQLRDFRAGNRTNDGQGQLMRKTAAQLSDAEIIALANYIAGLN